MSKAMLIMTMPVMCGICPCFGENEETYKHYCRAPVSADDDTVSFYEKPHWCSLIPEPPQATPDNSDMSIEWNLGWNACLDYLEGKSK